MIAACDRSVALRLSSCVAVFALCLPLGACATFTDAIPEQILDQSYHATFARLPPPAEHGTGTIVSDIPDKSRVEPAVIVRGDAGRHAPSPERPRPDQPNGSYVLRFDNADIRDIVKAVLGDMLGLSYVIDQNVKGSLSLYTAKPLVREAVLPAFEDALKLADAAVVSTAAGFQVIPLKDAPQRGSIALAGSAFQPGFQIRIVPLRYVSPVDVQRVLEPLVAPGSVIRGDPHASFVTLVGTEQEIVRAEQAIATFDVDWLRTQSFGLFPLRYSSAAEVAEDLGSVIGRDGPLAGVVRIAPIAHINAILVVSKTFTHVKEMRAWIERFDRGKDVSKSRLFVYHVQNGKAQDLATVLTKIYGQGRGGGPGSDEPGSGYSSATASPAGTAAASQNVGEAGGLGAGPLTMGGAPNSPFGVLYAAMATNGSANASQSGSSIIADEPNNSLLITATPARYAQIEAALTQLDAPPLQVMMEASIIEADINDTFKYGVQAGFEKAGVSTLGSSVAASALGTSTGGLSTALLRSNIQATLDFLSTLTKIRVISAPKLMVLNNHSASIQVGDQVPVATSSAVSTIASNAPTVNTIQLVDTGIILHVTPRVNRNGAVFLEVSQEVSASVPTVSSNIDSPTIQQRRVNTSVVVQDGKTIAIGGLIHDSRQRSRTGVPFLKDMPGVGALFGTTNDSVNRTELMVLITPKVIRDAADADAATDELSAKLPSLRSMRGPAPH